MSESTPGPKRTHWTAEQKQIIADMLNRGFTQNQVAVAMGTSQSAISRLAKNLEREVNEPKPYEEMTGLERLRARLPMDSPV